jgi:hypothetical protein
LAAFAFELITSSEGAPDDDLFAKLVARNLSAACHIIF